MSDILALSGEGHEVRVPSFMRTEAAEDGIPLSQVMVLDWWCPIQSDDDAADFVQGAMHFAAAVHFAKSGNLDILGFVCGAIQRNSPMLGPIELGFIDALVRKATVAIVPNEITDDRLNATINLSRGTLTFDGVRHGERAARDCLNVARELRFPELIASEMRSAIEGHFGQGAAGFIWTVCRAAMTGGHH